MDKHRPYIVPFGLFWTFIGVYVALLLTVIVGILRGV